MLIEKIDALKKSRIKISSPSSNWASQIGDPCERKLVYDRTCPEKKPAHDVRTQYVFDEGKLHEKAIVLELMEAGVDIIQYQLPFEIKPFQIRGKIEFKARTNGHLVLTEIKSITPYIFHKLNKPDDFFGYWWTCRIPAQLTVYMLSEGEKKALWYLKNRATGEQKEFFYEFDQDYADSLCKKAERINEAVEAFNNPDKDPQEEYFLPEKLNQPDHCDHCDFKAHCCPDLSYGDGLELAEDKELEEMLEIREGLRANYSEYNKVDKIVKHKIKGAENVLIGRFHVSGKWIDKKAYDVKATQYWKADISPV